MQRSVFVRQSVSPTRTVDASCRVTSATSQLDSDCVAGSSDVPAPSSVQECVASGMPCVPNASTWATAASSSCLAPTPRRENASPAVHLETHFLTCEEIEILAASREPLIGFPWGFFIPYLNKFPRESQARLFRLLCLEFVISN